MGRQPCGCNPETGYFCPTDKPKVADKAREQLKKDGYTQQQVNALGNDGAIKRAKVVHNLSLWEKIFGRKRK